MFFFEYFTSTALLARMLVRFPEIATPVRTTAAAKITITAANRMFFFEYFTSTALLARMLVRFPIKGHRPRGIRKAIALKSIYPTIHLRYLLHETDIRCTSNLGLRRLPSNFAIALKSPALRDLPSLGIRHAIACFLALGCALGLFSRSAFAEPPQRGASMQ